MYSTTKASKIFLIETETATIFYYWDARGESHLNVPGELPLKKPWDAKYLI